MVIGRFAPSPTGNLHIGNLRTALLAFWSVKSVGGRFLVRFEDLDRVTSSRDRAMKQLTDLVRVGIEPDEEPVFQSDRFDSYLDAVSTLTQQGLTYECYCSRKDVRDAAQAPHGRNVVYPGTCRQLTSKQRSEKRFERPAALRLRAQESSHSFTDLFVGTYEGPVDDVVLLRNDGVPSYNVAVVVDDALQEVTEVVRGDDLLWSTPTHIELQKLLELPAVTYRHVPLVVGIDGERLAKRHGAVTLDDLISVGVDIDDVRESLQKCSGIHDGVFSWNAVSPSTVMWDGASLREITDEE
jgi:glutamyl-tRNA synthetase